MIYLQDEEIRNLITVNEIIEAIESYYLTDGEERALVPERLFINDEENSALLMPSFYEEYYGAKLIGIAPGNAAIGEATLRGIIMLNDRKTMKPLAIMDARTITAMRTGAISGVGMKYMASDQADTVGIIGTGDQGYSHLQAACAVRPVKNVLVHNRGEERLEKFKQRCSREFPELHIRTAEPSDILREAQIIITTTTSKTPVIPYDETVDLRGKHFAGAGAFKPNMQEIPDEILTKADCIAVDTHAAFEECGEMIKMKNLGYSIDTIPDLKSVIKNPHDAWKEEITVCKSVGISIFDILAAKLIYEKYTK